MSASLKRHNVGFRYLIAGTDDGFKNQLQSAARKFGVLEEVLFVGWLDNLQKVDFYRAADLIAIPSLVEPFGIVALESLRYKRPSVPIITTFSGGLREILAEYDLAFNILQFDSAVEVALANLTNQVAANNQDDRANRILKKFDWAIITTSYLEIMAQAQAKHEKKL